MPSGEMSNYVRHTVSILRQHEVDVKALLHRHGIEESSLNDTAGRIDRVRYAEFLDDVIANYPIPGLGLLDGQDVSLLDHGILGYVMYSSATFGKALERHSRYQDLIGAVLRTALHIEGDTAWIRVVDIARPELTDTEAKMRYNAEQLFTLWSQHGPAFGMSGYWFSCIDFNFPKPPYSNMYTTFFNCPVRFQQPHLQAGFPAEYLDRPLSFANEEAAQLCEHQCASLLKELKQEEGLTGELRRRLAQQPGRYPSIDEMSVQVNLSARTLRRRLRDAGTTYKEVLMAFRMELASQYLRNSELSVADIAHLLGYSDTANFHRAFSRQYGQTPARYRSAV